MHKKVYEKRIEGDGEKHTLHDFRAHALAVNVVVMEITGFEQDYEYI